VLIADQLAVLAARLDLPCGPTAADTVERLLAELHRRTRRLLVWDKAERPQDVAAYTPGGAGHVLITSRCPGWSALGATSLWAATALTSAPVGLGKVEPVEPVCAHLKRFLSNLTKHSCSCPISPRTPSAQLTALVKTRLKRMQYRPDY
jgi:hypothetical protein